MRVNWRHHLLTVLAGFERRRVRYAGLALAGLAQVITVMVTATQFESSMRDLVGNLVIWSLLAIIVFSINWKQLLTNFIIATLIMPFAVTGMVTLTVAMGVLQWLLGHSDHTPIYFAQQVGMLFPIFFSTWSIWAFILGPKLILEALALHALRFYVVKRLRSSTPSSEATMAA